MNKKNLTTLLFITFLFGSGCLSNNNGLAPYGNLVAIEVEPLNVSISLGTSQQFKATGIYSSDQTQDITNLVTWISTNNLVATINNLDQKGLATSVNIGSSKIRAEYNGLASSEVMLQVTSSQIVSINITTNSTNIPLGTTQQLVAIGLFSDNTTQDITHDVSWSSNNEGVITINNGIASALSVGTTKIRALFNNVYSDETNFTVTQAVLVNISVTPPMSSMALGTTQQLIAVGIYSDNTAQVITELVEWTVYDSSKVIVGNVSGNKGLASAQSTGTTQIIATYQGVTSTPANVIVTSAHLVSIEVIPANESIALGTTQQFIALGFFTDNSSQNLTNMVVWSSTDVSVASISNTQGTNGLATSLTTGNTQIVATYQGTSSSPVDFTVSNPTLLTITIVPAFSSIALGTVIQFTAYGNYSDGSTQNLTNTVTWSSSDVSKAIISNLQGARGVVTSLSTGLTNITANYLGITSLPSALTITSATLTSISITPLSTNIPVGFVFQFTAYGNYSDGSTQNLTNTVTWSSSDVSKAIISNAPGSQGLATGLEVGTMSIIASYSGLTAVTSMEITSATLSSIILTPLNGVTPVGLTKQFFAVGHYSDGSTQDLTALVTWMSSNTSVATISNVQNTNGLAIGLSNGATQITAHKDGVDSISSNLNVTNSGSLDTTFGSNGSINTGQYSSESKGMFVAIQSNGKIIASTSTYHGFTILRYNTDGSLDLSFGNNGSVIVSGQFMATSMCLDINDGIIVTGAYQTYNLGNVTSSSFGLVRYSSEGILDTSFGGGYQLTDMSFSGLNFAKPFSVKVSSTGRIVVAGTAYDINSSSSVLALVRYNTDGSLDSTFGNGGRVFTNFSGYSLALLFDMSIDVLNNIIVTGGISSSIVSGYPILVRYDVNGNIDTTFGNNGKVIVSLALPKGAFTTINLQPDGKIVVAGSSRIYNVSTHEYIVARYNEDGSIDGTFGNNGFVSISANVSLYSESLSAGPNKGVVLLDSNWNILFRTPATLFSFTPEGDVNLTFANLGTLSGISTVPGTSSFLIQPDGKIVLGRSPLQSNYGISRIWP